MRITIRCFVARGQCCRPDWLPREDAGMTEKKSRVPVPKTLAARVLFEADRTCCVCRLTGKKVQIHHINDDPSDNRATNLAVLCLECHGDTQLVGGFGRKLDADQVHLYRDDWRGIVTRRRLAAIVAEAKTLETEAGRLEYYTSLTERLRENKDYTMLAWTFDSIGNTELRDKYVELALADEPDNDELIVHLRAMQGRQDLIPVEVAAQRLQRQTELSDWTQRARTQHDLGDTAAAAVDYVHGVQQALEQGRWFSAAYYLKEMTESGGVEALFERALTEAREEDDLWWQIRALQELGWNDELEQLLLDNADRVEREYPAAVPMLHAARGDFSAARAASLDVVTSGGRGQPVGTTGAESHRDGRAEESDRQPEL